MIIDEAFDAEKLIERTGAQLVKAWVAERQGQANLFRCPAQPARLNPEEGAETNHQWRKPADRHVRYAKTQGRQ